MHADEHIRYAPESPSVDVPDCHLGGDWSVTVGRLGYRIFLRNLSAFRTNQRSSPTADIRRTPGDNVSGRSMPSASALHRNNNSASILGDGRTPSTPSCRSRSTAPCNCWRSADSDAWAPLLPAAPALSRNGRRTKRHDRASRQIGAATSRQAPSHDPRLAHIRYRRFLWSDSRRLPTRAMANFTKAELNAVSAVPPPHAALPSAWSCATRNNASSVSAM